MKFGATLKALAASDANARGAFDYKGLKKRIKRLRSEEDAAARQAALREMHGVIVAEVSRVNQELSHRRALLDWVGGGVLPLESSPGAQALREFAELNATAVRKGVKKLDKALTDAERLEVLGWRDSRPVRIADPMDVSRSGATVGGLVRVLQDSEARARMPLEELGRGAFATVHALARDVKLHHSGSWAGGIDAEKGGAGPSVAIKHGHWSSQAAFEREVALQRAAAGAGVAPCVYFSRWLGGPLGKNGVVGMARLTSPSFFRWLCWETRELASAKARGGWLIHPSLSKQPIVCTWRAEARRLLAVLRSLNIAHRDGHEMNLMFHVPDNHYEPPTADSSAAEVAAAQEAKARILAAIRKGPGAAHARLFVIDFGRAKTVRGRLGWAIEYLVSGRRLPDPEQHRQSPMKGRGRV